MIFNPYIFIVYYQSNLLNYLLPNPVSYPYKMKYFTCISQARNSSWQYVNDVMQMSMNKEHYWLALTLLHLEARSRSHDISMLCIEKNKQSEMLVSSQATTLRMYPVNPQHSSCNYVFSIKVENSVDPNQTASSEAS